MSPSANAPTSIERDARYPLGRWVEPTVVDASMLKVALWELGELPQRLREAVRNLRDRQLDTPYREDGWTVRQLVHHIADSHMNFAQRLRLALTEDSPAVKAYDENAWAWLHDGAIAPVDWSLDLLEALHARLLMLLRSLRADQWQRVYVHPEDGPVRIDVAVHHYAWHSRHHVAHIMHLRAKKGW